MVCVARSFVSDALRRHRSGAAGRSRGRQAGTEAGCPQGAAPMGGDQLLKLVEGAKRILLPLIVGVQRRSERLQLVSNGLNQFTVKLLG